MPPRQIHELKSAIIDDQGTTFTYIDSGPPSPSIVPYTTIIATHGLAYNAHIFTRILRLAPKNNIRIVGVNRRPYGGSTPLPAAETGALATASKELKEKFLRDRGAEFASFIKLFVSQNDLPPASADGDSGGIALLAWSAGHSVVIGALGNFRALAPATQSVLTSHLRCVIMQEPPTPILGFPFAPKTWFFEMDTSIPEDQRQRMGTIWITSYFDHGDLSSRDPDALAYVVTSISRTPSIYSMSPDEKNAIIDESVSELGIMAFCLEQSNDGYLKMCFNSDIRAALPHMRIHALCGSKSPSFSPLAFWKMQSDDAERGGGFIKFHMIPDVNHFMHWDEPELAVRLYLNALGA